MPVVLVNSLGEPHMSDISDTIYNDILLKVNVYKKYLTGIFKKSDDFKAYYSLCIRGTESKKAFSHSKFDWTENLMDPSADQPLPQIEFVSRFKPGSRDLEQGGGSDFAYSHDPTPTASQLTSAAAGAAADAASAGASRFAAGVSDLGNNAKDRFTSLMKKNQQSDPQLRARAGDYLNFFKYALIGSGKTINVDGLYKNLRLLCNKFEFDDQQDILSKFSFPSDYDSGSLYSGRINSTNKLTITNHSGGYRKKKRKKRNTKRKNSKRRNTKRKKTYKRKRNTKKSKK